MTDQIAQNALVEAGLFQVQTYTMISDDDLLAPSPNGDGSRRCSAATPSGANLCPGIQPAEIRLGPDASDDAPVDPQDRQRKLKFSESVRVSRPPAPTSRRGSTICPTSGVP
ncbi:MAG: hypothetical protein R2849_23565 [Thermomicrobiales bacterium]